MLLIDGDIICYRTAFSRDADSLESCIEIADSYIENIVANAFPEDSTYKVFLSGTGNYRKDIAKTAVYKGNRKADKPQYIDDIRAHLLANHPSDLSQGEEADDRIAIEATAGGISSVICSIDKDFDQVPGWHYNFLKQDRYYITVREASLNFYCQILTGDRVDNVVGIKGIGPVKAKAMLKNCKTDAEMFAKCVEAFESKERVIENALLLWLRRIPNQIWKPPVC